MSNVDPLGLVVTDRRVLHGAGSWLQDGSFEPYPKKDSGEVDVRVESLSVGEWEMECM
jgi:hypothetical protein